LTVVKFIGSRDKAIVASIVLIGVLAIGFVYYYYQVTNEISSLRSAGQMVCRMESEVYGPMTSLVTNESSTLKQQIQNDSAIITFLNMTRPSGYASMIATLNNEIGQDNDMLALVNNLDLASTSIQPSDLTNLCGTLTG
jgi:hypothetical protein